MGKVYCLNCGTELNKNEDTCQNCGIHVCDIKYSFIDYLGSGDSLIGYQKSYKMVLLKSILEEYLDSSVLKIAPIVIRFKEYYEERIDQGLVADFDADSRILNIKESSLKDVLSVIKTNPLNAFKKQGFIDLDEEKGLFILAPGIDNFTVMETRSLLRLLDTKLKKYYRVNNKKTDDGSKGDYKSTGEEQLLKAGFFPIKDETRIPISLSSLNESEYEDCQSIEIDQLELSIGTKNLLKRNKVYNNQDLIKVVSDGTITLEKALTKVDITKEEFMDKMREEGYDLPE